MSFWEREVDYENEGNNCKIKTKSRRIGGDSETIIGRWCENHDLDVYLEIFRKEEGVTHTLERSGIGPGLLLLSRFF
jgi:hypothetical protein